MHFSTLQLSKDHQKTFEGYAKTFNSTVDNQEFIPDTVLANGFFKYKVLEEGFAVFSHTYQARELLYTMFERSTEELYILTFSFTHVPAGGNMHFQMEGITVNLEDAQWKHAFLLSSLFDLMVINPPGFKTAQLLCSVSKSWIEKNIDKEMADQFFLDYLRLKEKAFSMMELDESMTAQRETILNAIHTHQSETEILPVARHLVLEYFGKMKVMLHALGKAKYEEEIIRIFRHIQHLGDGFFLHPTDRKQMATQLALSETKFANLFKQIYGKSYYAYILAKRMDWALLMLTQHNIRVGAVAAALDYENFSRFTAAFKKHHGVLPSDVKAKQ